MGIKAFLAGYIVVSLLGVFSKTLGILPEIPWWRLTLLPLVLIGIFGVWLVVWRMCEEWWDIRREHQIEDRRRKR